MSSYRPKFSFSETNEIWSFSKWMLLGSVGKYLSSRGGELILGRLMPMSQLGVYKLGVEISAMPTNEIIFPFSRALVPGLVKIKDDHQRLLNAFYQSVSAMSLIVIPVAIGFGLVAEQFVPLFLGGGEKWSAVAPIVEVLVYSQAIISLYSLSGNLLVVIGKIKYTSILIWLRAVITLTSIYPLYNSWGIEGVLWFQVFVSLIFFMANNYLVVKEADVRFMLIINCFWRPVLASFVMSVLVNTVIQPIDSLLILLFSKIVLGFLSYICVLFLLWFISGKPDGFERKILEGINSVLVKKKCIRKG